MSDADLNTDPRVSRKARGLRLKSIRQSLRLSRQAFADKFTVSIYTLQNWETNKNGGLTEARATDILQLLKRAGIKCSFEWLMYGTPPAPVFSDPILGEISLESLNEDLDIKMTENDELRHISSELNLLRSHYPNQVMDMIVADDGMEPVYGLGEYVAGIKYTGSDIAQLIGADCIVVTEQNEQLLRQIRAGSMLEYYNLACINLKTIVAKPVLYDVAIKGAAPIIWTRIKISK
jgi:DNA-binding transcriptional regulator YiaG